MAEALCAAKSARDDYEAAAGWVEMLQRSGRGNDPYTLNSMQKLATEMLEPYELAMLGSTDPYLVRHIAAMSKHEKKQLWKQQKCYFCKKKAGHKWKDCPEAPGTLDAPD